MDTPTLPLWIVVERSDWTFEIWVDGLTEEEADALSDALCDIACGGQENNLLTPNRVTHIVSLAMTRRAMFPLIDRALGGDLEARLREWRSTTPPTSFEQIGHLLRAEDVVVSSETVRRWCIELGIESDGNAA